MALIFGLDKGYMIMFTLKLFIKLDIFLAGINFIKSIWNLSNEH